MSVITKYIDCIGKAKSGVIMGQSPPRITLSKASHTTSNPLSPHKYMIPYTYNMIPYMIYMMYVLLLLEIRAWGDGAKGWLGYGGESIFEWRAYTKCA